MNNYFASCPSNLEELLQEELEKYSVTEFEKQWRGIRFSTDDETCLDIILESRLASRVFREVTTFKFFSEEDFYKKAEAFHWSEVFAVKQTFKIKTVFDSAAAKFFKNAIYMSQKTKDGIVDHFRSTKGKRPDVDPKRAEVEFLLYVSAIEGEKGWSATIYLDMCGDSLSNRGIRVAGHQAPLRENLAAAIILSTDWNPDEDIFIDSMCGTGTLLHEAFMIKEKIPPSYMKIDKYIRNKVRPFSFLNHSWYKKRPDLITLCEKKMQEIHLSSAKKIAKCPTDQFFGFDISSKSLEIARSCFKRGLMADEIISLQRKDATQLVPPEGPGIVICNPPHGNRLEEESQLESLYHDYGENLKKNFKGYRAYIFTASPGLRKKVSLQTSQRIPFYNGKIECRLLKYTLY